MNQSQKQYSIRRIETLVSQRLNEAKVKCTVNAKTLSKTEKYQLVKAGKVQLVSLDKTLAGYYTFDEYDFTPHEVKASVDEVKLDGFKKKLNDAAQKAKDQIMLGDDCKEALKLIADLEAIKI